MSFAIDLRELRERASKRVAGVATVATLLPDEGSKVAAVAKVAETKTRMGGNPLLTPEQAERCHSPHWDNAEMQVFAERRDRLLRWGYLEQDADDLAERLTLRDREHDDRRTCAECRYGSSHRCPDGSPLLGNSLHRCASFTSQPTSN